MSFFKNIAVTYYTAQIYNDTLEDMKAEIDEQFSSPLLDAASNYVCAVERMELSGNNINFYSPDQDDDAIQDDDGRWYTVINFLDSDLITSHYTMFIYGSYSSLGSFISALNNWKLRQDSANATMPWLTFSLTGDGKILIMIDSKTADPRFGIDLLLKFSSAKVASIFGLPMDPATDTTITPVINARNWWHKYSEYTPYDDLAFQTKSSRIDCGIIPTMLQLRSTLPFESDQVSNAKANIVTDFNIVPGAAAEYSIGNYYDNYNQISTTTTDIENQDFIMQGIKSSGLSQGCGGMLVYTPNERRWLNFSAPIPIYYIRMWVELVTNDPDVSDDSTRYKIPPGGKFSIKLGFYLRDT